MDEINKIPPVTRTIVFATAVVTLGPLLKLVNPYLFLLWWPSILKKYEIWRVFTCFFLGSGDIQLLFDIFMLYRNSTDLETNFFYRKTSEYVWALGIINSLIIATNYPLQSTVLFTPFTMAIVYLWSRANPGSKVSFFGLINCPAPYLPYAYLLLDLLRGGMPLAIQSSTGIVSAYIYYFLREILPASNGGRGPRLLPSAPSFLQALLPDSPDPAVQGQAPTQPGGAVRSTAWGGTAFAPAGRTWGDTPPAGNTTGGQRLNSGGPGLGTRLAAWLPFGRRRGGASVGGSGSSSTSSNGPSREAMLAAAEARLRALRENSIAGRNQAASSLARQAANSKEAQARQNKAASTSAAGTVLGPGTDSKSSSVQSSEGSSQIRRTAAAGGPSTRAFTFGQYSASQSAKAGKEGEEEETASGSGGRVAEIRRKPESKDDQEAKPAAEGKTDYTWGTGRKLGD
jgi:Derlin-2/3